MEGLRVTNWYSAPTVKQNTMLIEGFQYDNLDRSVQCPSEKFHICLEKGINKHILKFNVWQKVKNNKCNTWNDLNTNKKSVSTIAFI
jgi:hypothetical protein